MNDGAALLRAIIENPDEDTPRLMYADWLEECAAEVTCDRCGGNGRALAPHRGEEAEQYIARRWIDCPKCQKSGCVSDGCRERADFIRVQCALARRDQFGGWECKVCGARPRPVDNFEFGEVEHGKGCYMLSEDGGGSEFVETDAEFRALREREDRLRRSLYDIGAFLELHRGFGSVWRGPAADWLTHADALLAAHPIREVGLTTWPELETAERDDKSSFLEARLAGRKFALTFDWMRERDQFEWVRKLVAAEWPQLKVTFPGYIDSFAPTAPI